MAWFASKATRQALPWPSIVPSPWFFSILRAGQQKADPVVSCPVGRIVGLIVADAGIIAPLARCRLMRLAR